MSRTLAVARRARRRLFAAEVVLLLGPGLTAGAVGSMALVMADRLMRLALPEWGLVAAPMGAALAAVVVIAWMRREGELAAAARVDAALGLRDRLSTGVALEGAAGDPFAAVAVQDAERAAGEVRVSRAVPVRFGWWWGAWPLGVAGAVVCAWLVPDFGTWGKDRLTREQMAARDAEQREAGKEITKAVEVVKQADSTGTADAATKESLAALEQLERELAEGRANPKEAREQAAKSVSALAEKMSEEAQQQQREADALQRELAAASKAGGDGAGGSAGRASSALADAIRRGDLEGARRAAEEMASGGMSEDERRQAAQAMERLSKDLEDLARKEEEGAREPGEQESVGAGAPGSNPGQALMDQGLSEEEAKQLAQETDAGALRQKLEQKGLSPEQAERAAQRVTEANKQRAAEGAAKQRAQELAKSLKDAAEAMKKEQQEQGQERKESEAEKPKQDGKSGEAGKQESRERSGEPKGERKEQEKQGEAAKEGEKGGEQGQKRGEKSGQQGEGQSGEKQAGEKGSGEEKTKGQGPGERMAGGGEKGPPKQGTGGEQKAGEGEKKSEPGAKQEEKNGQEGQGDRAKGDQAKSGEKQQGEQAGGEKGDQKGEGAREGTEGQKKEGSKEGTSTMQKPQQGKAADGGGERKDSEKSKDGAGAEQKSGEKTKTGEPGQKPDSTPGEEKGGQQDGKEQGEKKDGKRGEGPGEKPREKTGDSRGHVDGVKSDGKGGEKPDSGTAKPTETKPGEQAPPSATAPTPGTPGPGPTGTTPPGAPKGAGEPKGDAKGEQKGQGPGPSQEPGATPKPSPGTMVTPGQDGPKQPGATGSERASPQPGGERATGGGSADELRDLAKKLENMERVARDAKQRGKTSRELEEKARDMWNKADPKTREKIRQLASEMAKDRESDGPGGGPKPKAGGEGGVGSQGAEVSGKRGEAGAEREVRTEVVDARGKGADRPIDPAKERVVAEWLGDGKPGDKSVSRAEVQSTLAEAAKSAERAVEDRTVHSRYDKLIRKYFKRLPEAVGGKEEK